MGPEAGQRDWGVGTADRDHVCGETRRMLVRPGLPELEGHACGGLIQAVW